MSRTIMMFECVHDGPGPPGRMDAPALNITSESGSLVLTFAFMHVKALLAVRFRTLAFPLGASVKVLAIYPVP